MESLALVPVNVAVVPVLVWVESVSVVPVVVAVAEVTVVVSEETVRLLLVAVAVAVVGSQASALHTRSSSKPHPLASPAPA